MNVRFAKLLWNAAAAVALFTSTSVVQAEEMPDLGGRTRMILAVSWQPAFCETQPKRPECTSQTQARRDASHFSLHGLWSVRKSYCGVDERLKAVDTKGRWRDLPEVALPSEVKAELALAMPGVQSGLDRHEWIKHGTCSGLTAGEYYLLSTRLLAELNASDVRALFAGNVGRELDEASIRRAFDKSFGKGAGDRVKIQCKRDGDRRIITELTIGLSGDVTAANGDAGSLARAMARAGRTSFGCPSGIVDPVGLQ